MDEFAALGRGPSGEVVAFHECGAQPSGRRIKSNPNSSDAATDDHDVEFLGRQTMQVLLAIEIRHAPSLKPVTYGWH